MQIADCKLQNDGDKKSVILRARTKKYALRIISLYMALRENELGRVLGKQLLRSGTSVGAHYSEACRARSVAEFVSKMEGGLQELQETAYWMDLLVESKQIKAAKLKSLIDETSQLIAIFISSIRTSKNRRDS